MSNDKNLTGRVHEAGAIQEALMGLDSTGILLAGDPGTGKHELIKSIPQMNGQHGHVVKLLCSPTLSSTPYGALAPMLSVGNDSAPDVAVLRQMISAVRNVLKEHPEGDSLIILIQDAQYIDASSAFVLGQLVHSGLAKLVVLTTEKHVDELSLEALLRGAGLKRIHLGKLGLEETRQLCSALLPGPVTLGTAKIIAEQTNGNPFLVRHFVEAAHRQGTLLEQHGRWALSKVSPEPDINLREAVRGLHRRHGSEEQEAMELMSLAGPLPVAEIRSVTGMELTEDDQLGLIRLDDDTATITSNLYSAVLRTLIPPGQKQMLRQQYLGIRDPVRPHGFEELLWDMESGETLDHASIETSMKLANDNGRYDVAWEIAQNYVRETTTDGIAIERIRALFGQENSQTTPHRLAAALLPFRESKTSGKLLEARRIARWLISDRGIDSPHFMDHTETENVTNGLSAATENEWVDEAQIAGIEQCRQLFEVGDTAAAYESAVALKISDGSTLIRPVYYRLTLAVIAARSAATSGRYGRVQEIVEGFHFTSPADVLHAHGSLMLCKSLSYLFQGRISDARLASGESIPELEIADPEGLLDLARGINAYLAVVGTNGPHGPAMASESADPQRGKVRASSNRTDAERLLGSVYQELSLKEPRVQNLRASLAELKKLPYRVLEREALVLCWSAANVTGMGRGAADRFLEIVEPSPSKRQGALKQLIELNASMDLDGLESFATWAYEHDEKACAVEAVARVVGFMPADGSDREQGMHLRKIDNWINDLGGIPWGFAAEMLRVRGLTTREWEIVELARTGMSNKAIAGHLTVSQRTIEGHLYRIFAKLGLRTRRELRDLKPRRQDI